MLVNDSRCMCNRCAKSGYCDTQRTIIGVQRIVAKLSPDDLLLMLHVEWCPEHMSDTLLAPRSDDCGCNCDIDLAKEESDGV